ncbi:MAG: site-specific DNA-methyltransferase [Anaerolineae bacterium]|nr:site-specific DNA-methyltransferase [Phycisphaerae bacterium]
MELNKLYNSDCIAGMAKIPAGSIDLAFADPPFNIGYKYDVYEDRMAADQYLDWTRQWGKALVKTLKPTGTAWLAIGDDFAAELKMIFQRELGLCCRSWVIWYYTFGVNCKYKFSRSHTHLFHFVKNPKEFTFNRDAIRVPSARQLVYADARADSRGRIPDDTWILRPQDAPDSFTAEEDVWHFPRVCGTFKERAGWHGCQMPEQLLGRIINACSNAGETVLDPFGGSGTTLVVAKKLGRKFIGFELSDNYAAQIQARLNRASATEPLENTDDSPMKAPPTVAGKRRDEAGKRIATATGATQAPALPVARRANASLTDRGVVEAFVASRHGFPVDRIIADPELNEQFLAACVRLGVPGKPFDWNHRLMHLRKASILKGLPCSSRTVLPFKRKDFYRCKFACEIAIQRFETDFNVTLDHVLCDPKLASQFDELVLTMLPDKPSSLEIRWFALRIRKAADKISQGASKLSNRIAMPREFKSPFSVEASSVPAAPGLYWLRGDGRNLYVGETDNLQDRFAVQFGHKKFDFWNTPLTKLMLTFKQTDVPIAALPKHQSRWISEWQPIGNFGKLAATR